MVAIKKVCKAVSVVSLVAAMITQKAEFAVIAITLAAVSVDIEIKHWRE